MSSDLERELTATINSLSSKLSQKASEKGEKPIRAENGRLAWELTYSHNPKDRQLGYTTLVAALRGNSPTAARAGLVLYALRDGYREVALDEIARADEEAKEAGTEESAAA
jgi:hypothetical protein